MNILVTGATGFLGSRLVEHLLNDNAISSILATGRNLKSHINITSDKLSYKLGDLSDFDFVKSLFETKIDVVVNCASLSSPWGSYDEFYKANCLTQSNLIQLSKAAEVKRFIYISSPSIYFNFKDKIAITEKDPIAETMVNSYAKTKVESEEMINQSGLSFVILRPRALIGRGDTVIMPRLIRSCKERKLRIIGDGKNIVDLTPVSNMVEAIRLAIYADEVKANQAYNISNGEPVNLWDSINYVLTELNLQTIVNRLPYKLSIFLAYMMELKARLFASKTEPVLTRYSVAVLAKSFTFNINKAKTNLAFQPKQSTKDAIDEFVTWYKNLNDDIS